MGTGNSKIIHYGEAEKRCGPSNWNKYNQGFNRICNHEDVLEFNSFCIYFLGKHVPEILSRRIFEVFDGKKTGFVSRKEFLCGLTILLHGTIDEKLAFIFALYDDDESGKISKKEMNFWLQVLKGILNDTNFVRSLKLEYKKADEASGSSLYGYRRGELDFKQFKEWCKKIINFKDIEEQYIEEEEEEEEEKKESSTKEEEEEKESSTKEEEDQEPKVIEIKKRIKKRGPMFLLWLWDLLDNDFLQEDLNKIVQQYEYDTNIYQYHFNIKQLNIIQHTYHQLLIFKPVLKFQPLELLLNFFPLEFKELISLVIKKHEIHNHQQFIQVLSIFSQENVMKILEYCYYLLTKAEHQFLTFKEVKFLFFDCFNIEKNDITFKKLLNNLEHENEIDCDEFLTLCNDDFIYKKILSPIFLKIKLHTYYKCGLPLSNGKDEYIVVSKILEDVHKDCKKSECVYLIDNDWYQQWINYMSSEEEEEENFKKRPLMIKNKSLLVNNNDLNTIIELSLSNSGTESTNNNKEEDVIEELQQKKKKKISHQKKN